MLLPRRTPCRRPYCQRVTTVYGKQYVATAPLIDKECEAYTEYPSKVVPVTEPPKSDEPIQTPFTITNDGTVLVYSAYVTSTMKGFGTVATATIGYGDQSTVSTPLPTQTTVDNDGSGQCGTSDKLSKDDLGDACDRAINDFDADTIYTGYTTRYSRSKKGILMAVSFGQAACIAKFECDDYGIGMKGSDIIAARENAKENDGIWMCGHIRLSNSCSVVVDYCTNCVNKG
ncbi:meiotically up-regulated gene family-domain-containing protein [Fusarium tricinctum]|uniref:Meiotically up-regulated gene family-domain-containing protein n=1 Tax=Fusarium tricinctum TaxID=61284 RepID=A0A8K0S6J0_9HYPO|nr:meiotically up-regulated gene family-domain-containing protein [Fusarium tricinctum]